MQKYLYISLFIVPCLLLSACDSTTPMEMEKEKEEEAQELSFDFDNPDSNFQLPALLEEISGISFIDDSTLVAVNDEIGFIYFIDANTGVLTRNINWGAAADYEDVEIIDGDAWILRSDGRLFELRLNDDYDLDSVVEYTTALTSANDTEGLAYDEENNRLLIACKESPGIGHSSYSRTIYAFDLASKTMVDEAVLVIDFEEVNGSLPIEGYRIQDFKPSAIGVHPVTKEWFVVSAIKKGALAFEEGVLSGINNWNDDLFQKPEGIAFNTAGDMFVSNEGNGAEPTLLRFNAQYQNN